MKDELVRVWQPRYVADFQCDGSLCGAKCCQNAWDIVIDEAAYKRYGELAVQEERERILAAIEPRREAAGYRIRFDEEHACPLLCEDKRCYVQAAYGGDALSEVCMTYPRKLIQLSACQLRSLSMTCPVAAEQALLGAGKMAFSQVDNRADYAWDILAAKQPVELPQFGELVEGIIRGCVLILQDESYTRSERLVLLGLFLDRADEMRERGLPGVEFIALAEYYHTAAFRNSIAALLADFSFVEAENRRYFAGLLQALAAKTVLEDAEGLERSIYSFDTSCRKYRQQVEEHFGKALDNFLVQEFLYQGYPFRVEGSFLHNYLVFLQSVCLWEVMLYGTLARQGRMLSKVELLDLVGRYCYTADHKLEFINCLSEACTGFEANPLEFMQMLLRLS